MERKELTGPHLRGLTRLLTAGSKIRFLLGDRELEVLAAEVQGVGKNPKTGETEIHRTPDLVIRLSLSESPPCKSSANGGG